MVALESSNGHKQSFGILYEPQGFSFLDMIRLPGEGKVLIEKMPLVVHYPAGRVTANASMVAEALERRNQSWFVQTKVASDLIIQIGDNSFHLHKLPMVSRSGYLSRLVFQRSSNGEEDTSLNIQIDNLPGGSKIFELVVKFCYGWKIDLKATTIAPLSCAAHFLEMNDDPDQGNLTFKTEAFLSFVLLSSWRDTFHIFKTCESISSWARELQILKQCSEAIAWRACIDPKAIIFGNITQNA
ncbi:hypothetical protein L1049_020741 [Liquidambar formosana]|uniref:BTB domain-containing protein n=1 Tax=Liquidambar formosana TaxID=63359 RepID=A0AAP0S8C9_LIQFO